ncbi:MAG TPA: hypothetical protein PK191_04065 [Niabella sp.]|nr:hypothetical protein [Niabella sp.]HOZ97334.1 hypothetical protein [Niabella sp.]HQW15395.1 hypothetical protein [Niabella sp.]HQX20559.1 hypothetical protein [Niabella sp.]HQX41092.1 hypothetical protein [Niabella sp.]
MRSVLVFIIFLWGFTAFAQNPIQNIGNRFSGMQNAGNQSLQKRNLSDDSVSISFRYLDTARIYKMDSSIADFTVKFPIPNDYYYLGNTGSAAQSYLFSPTMKAGWDPGFHSFDIYKYTIDKAQFFNSTRPYTEITYLLGSRSEQYIELMHTQNFNPNWNAHLQYRLINAPGAFKNQTTSHNNYKFTNWARSKNKRYNNFIAIVSNKLRSGENGGIDPSYNYLDDPNYGERFIIPTQLGGNSTYSTNFFNTDVATGNKYDNLDVVMRHQFDLGKKDSIVTDTTVIPLYYPRFRLEHTFSYNLSKYLFSDANPVSNYYTLNYNLNQVDNPFRREDFWREMANDFSIYTFPDAKSTQQFIKLGAALQHLKGTFRDNVIETPDGIHYADDLINKGYNIIGHGEYRNKTRNQRWDLQARGKLFFAGMNAGDYEAAASIQSALGKKIGSLQLGFENVNRTPSYITNANSAFYLMPNAMDLKKENSTHLFANLFQPLLKLGLSGHYYLVNNYVYYTDFYKINQAQIFNVVQLAAHKTFSTGAKNQLKWISDVYFQQVIGNGPVNVPLIFTHNRFMYEGNLGYSHLRIALGLDTRYRTNYKTNTYSPLLGQFMYQDTATVKYKMPEIAAFVHFRINSFRAFLRAENLNTARVLNGEFGFNNNNFGVQNYPYPGLLIRVGIYWGFVN